MLLVHAGQLWTGEQLLTDAGLLCTDGQIQAVGSWDDLRARYPEAKVVGGPQIIALPGFVNAHHHGRGITSFMAGTADDCLETWLAARSAEPPCDPYLDTLWTAIGLLEGGFTSVALFQATRRMDSALQEANERIRACRDAGLRVAFGLDLKHQNRYVYGSDSAGAAPPPVMSVEQYLAILEQLRAQWAHDPLVSIFAAPSGPQWVTDEAWQDLGRWTSEHGVPLHTHCLESPYQKEWANRAYDGSMVTYLDQMGALHERTSMVHGVWLSDEELALMAKVGTSLITNPGSNLRLRAGVSPVLRALEHGVKVALGTDGASVGDRDDGLHEMQLLLNLHRPPGLVGEPLTWEQAMAAATRDAAAVTPWAGRTGLLAEGMLADVVLYDLEQVKHPWTHPRHHPVAVLAQRGSRQHLAAVVVQGELVWSREEGLTRVNRAEVAQELRTQLEAQDLAERPALVEQVRAFYKAWD